MPKREDCPNNLPGYDDRSCDTCDDPDCKWSRVNIDQQQPPDDDAGDTARPCVAVDLDDQIAGVADLVFDLVSDNLSRLSSCEPTDGQVWTIASAVLSAATHRAAIYAIQNGCNGKELARIVQNAARLSVDRTEAEIRAKS